MQPSQRSPIEAQMGSTQLFAQRELKWNLDSLLSVQSAWWRLHPNTQHNAPALTHTLPSAATRRAWQRQARACSPNTMPVKSVRALVPPKRVLASAGGSPVAPLAAAAKSGPPALPPAPAPRAAA